MPREELIIVNGKPLSQYVAEMEAKEEAERQRLKGIEVTNLHKEEIKEQKKLRYYDTKTKVIPKRKFRKYQKNSKVIFLSDDQIRKEYGIMSKKYESIAENVIWLMKNEGPITVAECARKLEVKLSSVSASASTIYKALLNTGFISREKLEGNKGAYAYKIEGISIRSAHSRYKREANWQKQNPAKVERTSEVKPKSIDKVLNQGSRKIKRRKKKLDIASSVGEIAGQINEQLNKLVFPSEIKITVDVRFGFIK